MWIFRINCGPSNFTFDWAFYRCTSRVTAFISDLNVIFSHVFDIWAHSTFILLHTVMLWSDPTLFGRSHDVSDVCRESGDVSKRLREITVCPVTPSWLWFCSSLRTRSFMKENVGSWFQALVMEQVRTKDQHKTPAALYKTAKTTRHWFVEESFIISRT